MPSWNHLAPWIRPQQQICTYIIGSYTQQSVEVLRYLFLKILICSILFIFRKILINYQEYKGVTRMSHVCHTHVCRMCKSKKHTWHQTMHVQACKISAPHTSTYPYELFAMKQSLQPVASALSFIIYTCRNIFIGMVTDILGHLRHTAFVATCS